MSDIQKIRIKNFKNLEDVEIEVKPLTFLFGPNGSGKSSFIKALKFLHKNIFPLKNLLNNNDTNFDIGNSLNLGTYEEIITDSEKKQNLQYEFVISGFSLNYDINKIKFNNKSGEKISNNKRNLVLNNSELSMIELTKSYSDLNYIGSKSKIFSSEYTTLLGSSHLSRNKDYKIRVEFSFEEHEGLNYIKVNISDKENGNYLIINDTEKIEINPNVFKKRPNNVKINFLNNDEYCNYFLKNLFKFVRFDSDTEFEIPKIPDIQDFINGNLTLLELYKENTTGNTLFNNKETQQDYNIRLEKEELIIDNWLKLSKQTRMSKLFKVLEFVVTSFYGIWENLKILGKTHLPTVREIPKPKYLLVNNLFDKNEYYNFINKIWDHQESDDPDETYEGPFPGIHKITNGYLNILGFNKTIEIIKNKDIGSIVFKNKNGKITNLASESSGLIQILPVLLSLADENLFSVEQPELHLHPKLQSAFAYILLIAERFLSKEISDKKSTFYKDEFILIETHSEHIIRKIQILIAKGELGREKVAVYYFDNIEGSTKVKKMEIEENGFFKEPWPNGFFDDSANLSWELLTANKN